MKSKNLDVLFKNLDYISTDHFQIDLDHHNKKAVNRIVKEITLFLCPKKVIVSRNVIRYKHYHLEIYLKRRIKYSKILLIRLLFGDHQDRIGADINRLAHGELDTFDYVGHRKYEINLKNGEIKKLGEYKRIQL